MYLRQAIWARLVKQAYPNVIGNAEDMLNAQQSEDEHTRQIGGGDVQMEQPDADGDSKFKDITSNLKRQARK